LVGSTNGMDPVGLKSGRSGHKIRVEVDASLAARGAISAEVVNYVAQCIDIIKVYKRNLTGASSFKLSTPTA